jgi:adenosylmethionine-8-amino-7-oxononanoate aminotransferase
MNDTEMIGYLWTHRTQDHPWLGDDELLIDRAEGVWLWTQRGKKLLDGFAGLAVVNVGHGRREIAEAIAEQTVKLAYYPTTRQFSNRPAAELAERLAALTPGDLRYSMFAVSITREEVDHLAGVIAESVHELERDLGRNVS